MCIDRLRADFEGEEYFKEINTNYGLFFCPSSFVSLKFTFIPRIYYHFIPEIKIAGTLFIIEPLKIFKASYYCKITSR